MKTRITTWCKNTENERFLIALELFAETNMVKSLIFKEEDVTDEFWENIKSKWKNNEEIEMPAHQTAENELSLSNPLTPEGFTAEKESDVSVKQNEWNFIVLSSKLFQSYKSELEELKDRVERVEKFDKGIWENLKSFWTKVQDQLREKNLFREHGNQLKEITNELFSKLKDLRTKMDKEFNLESNKNKQDLYKELDVIDEKIKDGKRLQAVFDELKKIQQRLRNFKLNKDDRAKVWERIDKAFKEVKQKKFGSAGQAGGMSPLDRLKKRYDGLIEAIQKMENSIKRDKNDLDYHNRKEARSDNQLEAQISIAKIAMIEERIRSKSEKLGEMNKTKSELEKKKVFLEEQESKKQEEEKIKQAKEEIKEKIATEIEEKNKSADPKLEQIASTIKDGAQKVKDAAEKIEDKLEDIADKAEDKLEAIADKMEDKLEKVKDQLEEKAEVIEEKVEEIADKAVEKAKDIASNIKANLDQTLDKIKGDGEEKDA